MQSNVSNNALLKNRRTLDTDLLFNTEQERIFRMKSSQNSIVRRNLTERNFYVGLAFFPRYIFFSFVSAMNRLNWFCISERQKKNTDWLYTLLNTQVNKVTTDQIKLVVKVMKRNNRLKLRKEMRTFLKID